MTRRIPRRLLPHRGTSVKPFTGTGPRGPIYTDPVPVKRSQVEQKTRLVRDKDGREVVSSTTVYLEPGPHADPGSIVTVHTGKPAERTAKLITTEYMQHPQVGEYLAWRLE